MVVANRNALPEEKANLSADRTDHLTLSFGDLLLYVTIPGWERRSQYFDCGHH